MYSEFTFTYCSLIANIELHENDVNKCNLILHSTWATIGSWSETCILIRKAAVLQVVPDVNSGHFLWQSMPLWKWSCVLVLKFSTKLNMQLWLPSLKGECKGKFTTAEVSYIHAYIHIHTCIHTYIYIHTHIYTYIHTYIHTLHYIHPNTRKSSKQHYDSPFPVTAFYFFALFCPPSAPSVLSNFFIYYIPHKHPFLSLCALYHCLFVFLPPFLDYFHLFALYFVFVTNFSPCLLVLFPSPLFNISHESHIFLHRLTLSASFRPLRDKWVTNVKQLSDWCGR
jgi:hypothetical protein